MDYMDSISIISVIVGFLVYFFTGKRLLDGVQVREGGVACIYLLPAAASGSLAGFGVYFILKAFQ
jgi:hypothetical protein